MTTDVATATPAEIDTEIAQVQSQVSRLRAKREQAFDTIDRINKVEGTYEADYSWNSPERKAEAMEVARQTGEEITALLLSIEPHQTRYAAERWTRFYLVTNSNGHVHSSTACDTCFVTTSFAWLTQYSGMTHDALVDLAGESACTVCFPNAPVDVLRQKSRLSTPEQEARRREREEKAAAKEAAQVVVDGMMGWTNEGRGKHVYKTERGATNAIAGWVSSIATWNGDHPTMPEWVNNIAKVREALAAKGVEYDYDAVVEKHRKRVRKDGYTPNF